MTGFHGPNRGGPRRTAVGGFTPCRGTAVGGPPWPPKGPPRVDPPKGIPPRTPLHTQQFRDSCGVVLACWGPKVAELS